MSYINTYEIATTIFEFSALAIPAIAIYMQILRSYYDGNETLSDASTYNNYQLARGSISIFGLSGAILVVYYLIVAPPVVFGGYLSEKLFDIAILLVYISMLLISLGLFLFVLAVAINHSRLDEDDQSITGALRSLR